MMYRYLVFVMDIYYPSGGMTDCEGKVNTLSEVVGIINENPSRDYYQVYDCETGNIYDDEEIKKIWKEQ